MQQLYSFQPRLFSSPHCQHLQDQPWSLAWSNISAKASSTYGLQLSYQPANTKKQNCYILYYELIQGKLYVIFTYQKKEHYVCDEYED